MSVNQNQVAVNSGASLFVGQGNATTPTTANPYVSIGVLTTDQINIDGVRVDGSTAGGGQLLINGVAVATVNQNVSSVTNWAQYPATSSITFATGGGTGGQITMNVGNFSTINVSSINSAVPEATIYVSGTTFSRNDQVLANINTPQACVSTAFTYSFLQGHQYQITAPTSFQLVSYAGTGGLVVGIEPTNQITTGTSPVYRGGITYNYIAPSPAETIADGSFFVQTITNNLYANSNFTAPIGMWMNLNINNGGGGTNVGLSNVQLNTSICFGNLDTLVIQDLGVATQN